jgi:hypothetical protein
MIDLRMDIVVWSMGILVGMFWEGGGGIMMMMMMVIVLLTLVMI